MAKVTNEMIEQAFILYEELNSMQKVADKLKVSKGTVSNILRKHNKNERHIKLLDDYRKTREESNKKLLEMLQSSQVDYVVNLAIKKLNSSNMDYDIEKSGIGNMYRLIGMFTDKQLNIKDMKLKERQMALRERELELKEKELELRITNPEMFHSVQIVNDAPKWEKENASAD